MNPCGKIDAYLDGDLSAEEAAVFESHLDQCAECSGRVAQWKSVKDSLDHVENSAATALERLSPPQTAALLDAAEGETGGRALWTARPVPAFAALTVIIIAAVVILWPEAEKTVRPGQDTGIDVSARLTVPGKRAGAVIQNPVSRLLKAPSGSSVHVEIGSDLVELKGPGSMRISGAQRARTIISLNSGSLMCTVTPGRDREFIVQTDPYRVRVTGTRFRVDRPGGTRIKVAVFEGTVEVSAPQNASWRVSAGEGLVIPSFDEISKAVITSLSQKTDSRVAGTPHMPVRDTASRKPSRRPQSEIETWRQWIIDGKLDQAEEALEAYLKRKRRDTAAWSLLADARRKKRDYAGAVDAYGQVIRHASSQEAGIARFRAGVLLQDRMRSHAKAVGLFEKYLNSSSVDSALRPEALMRLAVSQLAMGNKSAAIRSLEEILEKHQATSAASRARKMLSKLKGGAG